MKRFASIIFTFLLVVHANAQVEQPRCRFEMGVAGGMNFSSMEFQPSIRQNFLNGYGGGLNLRYTSEKYFSMICAAQLEINFSQKGWEEDFDDGTANRYCRQLNYIEVPLLAHLSCGKEQNGQQFFIHLGPQFGLFIGDSETYEGTWKPEERPTSLRPVYGKDVYNKFDYGIAGGAGIELKTKAGNFFIEGRYYYGLADIFNNSKLDDFGRSANQTITARIGYSVIIFK